MTIYCWGIKWDNPVQKDAGVSKKGSLWPFINMHLLVENIIFKIFDNISLVVLMSCTFLCYFQRWYGLYAIHFKNFVIFSEEIN